MDLRQISLPIPLPSPLGSQPAPPTPKVESVDPAEPVGSPELPTSHIRSIERAREMYESDDIEIDDDPEVALGPEGEGAWVAAWVWVPAEGSDEP